jgi:hypothetical protein
MLYFADYVFFFIVLCSVYLVAIQLEELVHRRSHKSDRSCADVDRHTAGERR